jgi:hypothetical protein
MTKQYQIKQELLLQDNNILKPVFNTYYFIDNKLSCIEFHSYDGNGTTKPDYSLYVSPSDLVCSESNYVAPEPVPYVCHKPNKLLCWNKPVRNTLPTKPISFKPVHICGGNLYFKHKYKVMNDLTSPEIQRILMSQYKPHKAVFNENIHHTIYLYTTGVIVIEFGGVIGGVAIKKHYVI